MKRIIIVCLTLALFAGCAKNNNSPSCPTPTYNVSGIGQGNLSVSLSNSYSYGFLNIEYGVNGFSRGSGTKVTLSSHGGQISGLTNGTYDVYIQGNCGGTNNSSWAGPVSALVTGGTVAGNCSPPFNLSAYVTTNNVMVSWTPPYDISGSTVYDVHFDTTGFPVGGGHSLTANSPSVTLTSLLSNTTYDIMVRAKCDDGNWGPWSVRKSFYFSGGNSTQCVGPSYINVSNQGGNLENFSWDLGNCSSFEYGLGGSATSPPGNPSSTTQSNVTTGYFTSGNTYYFFVRGICADNSRTAWVGKTFTF
jgi:hypothetical protein